MSTPVVLVVSEVHLKNNGELLVVRSKLLSTNRVEKAA